MRLFLPIAIGIARAVAGIKKWFLGIPFRISFFTTSFIDPPSLKNYGGR
ncbi:MAG: hypothetical protein ACHQD8_00390 [Chitinophagales bacterium]